jgi:hypothetical protein
LTFALTPFYQVIESSDSNEFKLYYQLAWTKLNLKTFTKQAIEQVLVDQNSDRFYCLTILLKDQEPLIIEKHPTLDVANLRVEELQNVLN